MGRNSGCDTRPQAHVVRKKKRIASLEASATTPTAIVRRGLCELKLRNIYVARTLSNPDTRKPGPPTENPRFLTKSPMRVCIVH